ncbi:MAG: low temperature requirement protein A [Candidatus Sericytochromatia bacterium]|nr:low temperature requirement protein A [Candidatus Sericytochromatia bacterium]
MASRWFQPPSLRIDGDLGRERRTGWLELFYDLILVAAVSQLSLHLAQHMTVVGLLGFVLLFVPIWWSWIGATFYHDRFEADDVGHRLIIFALMAANANVAAHVPTALTTNPAGFALAYVGLRLIICFMWGRGGYYSPVARPLTHRYLVGFGLAILLWLVSTQVAGPVRFGLWALASLIEVATPLFTFQAQAHLPRLSQSHLPERFGLLTLIVLGESVVAATNGVAGQAVTRTAAVAGLLALGFSFCLWWLYFDNIMGRRLKRGMRMVATWVYGHLGLAMALTALGAALLTLIRHAAEPAVPTGLRWLVCGATAMALFALGLLDTATDTPVTDEHMRWLASMGAMGALLIALMGGGLSSWALITWLLALGVALVIGDLVARPVGAATESPFG